MQWTLHLSWYSGVSELGWQAPNASDQSRSYYPFRFALPLPYFKWLRLRWGFGFTSHRAKEKQHQREADQPYLYIQVVHFYNIQFEARRTQRGAPEEKKQIDQEYIMHQCGYFFSYRSLLRLLFVRSFFICLSFTLTGWRRSTKDQPTGVQPGKQAMEEEEEDAKKMRCRIDW